MHQCELIKPESSTDQIWTEWSQLMERVPGEQQLFGPDWFRIWTETWGATGQWTGQSSIVTARDDNGVLQGLLALGRPQIGTIRVYSAGGHNVPHRGIIAAQAQQSTVGAAIGQFLAHQHWPLVQLGPLLNTSPACQAMIQQLRECGVHLRHHDSREEITLHAPTTWDEYRSEILGSKFARKLGYYERRMQRAGHTTVKHYRQPSADETQTMMAALSTIESASWMATREGAIPRFTNPELARFWQELTVRLLSPRDHLDCWVLDFDGHPVSFCFTLTDGTTRYVIANNYDNSVRDHRTGSTLYRHMIQDGIERGIRRFEFADGDLHYKSLWGARVDGSRDTWLAVPNRVLGWGASAADRLYGLVRPQRPVAESGEPSDGSTSPAPSQAATTTGA